MREREREREREKREERRERERREREAVNFPLKFTDTRASIVGLEKWIASQLRQQSIVHEDDISRVSLQNEPF
jgi:hypothetical protein